MRCAQVLSRRGQNIEALHVAAIPGQHDESEMTIITVGQMSVKKQVVAQLSKLIDVISINIK